MKMLLKAAATAALIVGATSAQAALVFNLTEVGNDLVLTGSGTLDMTGLTYQYQNFHSDGYFDASNTTLRVGDSQDYLYTGLSGYSAANPWGSSGYFATGANTGPGFGFNPAGPGYVFLPVGYVSGTQLDSTSTFANRSLASQALNRAATSTRRPTTRSR